MKLKDLVKGIYPEGLPRRYASFNVRAVTPDSRFVQKNDMFIAVKGADRDGHDFIEQAVLKGAQVIVESENRLKNSDLCILKVADTKRFLADASQRFFNYPSKKIKTIGITGTNGKTTITYLIESILNAGRKKCGVLGTINHRLGKKIISSKNTTPGVIDNQRYLSDMLKNRCQYCVMEVSSHALDQGRVEGIDFKAAVFTNLTGDHLDYHRNLENYFLAKSRLFTSLSSAANAVINIDDSYGQRLTRMTKGKVFTYGLKGQAKIKACRIELDFRGSAFTICSPFGEITIRTSLIGRHNVYNILAAAAVSLALGIPLKTIKKGIENLKSVPGRLERVSGGQDFHIFVDYAHTEDALRNVLSNLRIVSKARILVVFGCGGDRDRTKRPKMGKAATDLADEAIITSDNPRSENPESIIREIVSGCKKQNYTVMIDRKKAIKEALSRAQKNDVVLIAGKGHETYQIFKNKTIHFDDREIVKKYLHAYR